MQFGKDDAEKRPLHFKAENGKIAKNHDEMQRILQGITIKVKEKDALDVRMKVLAAELIEAPIEVNLTNKLASPEQIIR